MSQRPTLVKTVTRTLRDGIGVYLFKLSRDLAKLLDAENDPDIDIGRREELDKSIETVENKRANTFTRY